MQTFDSAGTEIAYIDEGQGDPVLLLHGFASNVRTTWVETGWVRLLKQAGFRVVAFDARGHGRSEKLYELEAYASEHMAGDCRRLLDLLRIPRADVMGYSMGARITAVLTLQEPERVRSAILAGLGINLVRNVGASGPIARAFEARRAEDVVSDTARSFRIFAESTGSDLRALAACMRSSRERIAPEALGTIRKPVLVAVGSRDVLAGSAARLAALIPAAEVLDIENRDHMTAVGDRIYKNGVLDFLSRRP